MVESSKILTVSYGTFSCTLEGFDDSFGTMKAIAEYFRDLAQGDRYFGAEPPAPDAEMLTRIAEKEIARRVEARADESGIVLRAVDKQQTPVAAPVMPPVASPPSDADVAEAAADVATDIADEVAEDSVAEDAVADAPIEEIEDTTQTATADMDGDVAGPEAEESMSSPLVASSPATPEFADTSIADTATNDEMDVTAPAASFEDMAPETINAVPAHPDADSVAAKLQRIRAVVSSGVVAKTETADAKLSDSAPADESDDAEVAEESVADMIADADVAEDLEADAEEAIAETVEEAEVEAVEETEVEAEISEPVAEDTADTPDDDAEELETPEAEAEEAKTADADTEEVAAGEDAPKQNFRARILRVAKKTKVLPIVQDDAADLSEGIADQASAVVEKAIAEDADGPESIFEDIDADEVAELAPSENDAMAALSDEDEAALLADLAEVEAEVAESAPQVADVEDIAEDVVEVEEPEVVAEDIAPAGRDILPEADDAAMSRIMDQADEQLSEPEGSRRRSAIAQLKAAVAATEAARQLGDKGSDVAAKENAFRDDLNNAVRPGTSKPLPRTEVRAERPRPAPLKLVASQRVDEENNTDQDAAVLPRRVSTSAATDSSFSDFAAEMGATELPDLLEAAAAYTAYVEGIEDFSRPQIMKKVQASSAEEFSREDGLRSFGTLLRQGRISKVRNGRFQVSDQTRFKPEQKAG